jgi:alpha-aminoadipate carrier protein LysW
MAICPECEEELEIDDIDVEEGDIISCDQCGSTLRVVSASPLELEAYDEDDEDDDEEEEFDEDEDEEGADEDEDEDEDEGWDE